jgi:hypothetical protein
MRHIRRLVLAVSVVTGSFLGSLGQSQGVDLTGAWVTNPSECRNVFIRKGKANQLTFAPMSEVHGGGFIVEADRLIGRSATCTIKSRKDDGERVNILAGCATDIMLSSVQFDLKVVDQNKITRLFPGMEDMEIHYYRCSF